MTTVRTTSIASDEEVAQMLTELSNSDEAYQTRDYSPSEMDCMAVKRGFESFTSRVEKHGWMEMGHQHSLRGQYSLK